MIKLIIINLKLKEYFYPSENALEYPFETAIEEYKDKVFVVYSKDTFIRLNKFLKYKKYDYNISYNKLNKIEGKINILVLPIENIGEDVIILDRPEFNDFDNDVFENTSYKYLKTSRNLKSVRITREFFLYLYKKFKILMYTTNDIYEFMENIRNESDVEINYFTVRLALDIMKEMNILNYSLKNDKLSLSFNKITKKSDINNTNIMKKLNFRLGTY